MSAPISAAKSGIHKAVIPAAGLGTRLRPLTRAFPKEMLPIGRMPVLAHVTAELRRAGITEALFIVSERKPQIRAYFGDAITDDADGNESREAPLRCDYVVQQEQRGLGDALLCAEEWVGGKPFVVAFGDCLIDAPKTPEQVEPLNRLIAAHQSRQASASVLVETVAWEKVSRYGVLAPEQPQPPTPTEPFAALDIIEKPAQADAPSNLVVAARWVLTPDIFTELRRATFDTRGELNLTDSVRALRRGGKPFWAVPLRPGEARRDIGNLESFLTAFVRAAVCDPEFGAAAFQAAQEEWSRRQN